MSSKTMRVVETGYRTESGYEYIIYGDANDHYDMDTSDAMYDEFQARLTVVHDVIVSVWQVFGDITFDGGKQECRAERRSVLPLAS